MKQKGFIQHYLSVINIEPKPSRIKKTNRHANRFRKNSAGFTLIELLVVISIIGLLASIALVSLNGARIKARTAKVNVDLQQIYKNIELARNNNNSILQGITGNYWTEGTGGCNGYPATRDMRNLPATDPCLIYLNQQWQKIGLPKAPIDPWGSPYGIDENELESGSCSTSSKDLVSSNGPDGIYGTSDDIQLFIPFFQCTG